jgi:hypothetical protein
MKSYTYILPILMLLLVSLRTNAQDSIYYKNAVMLEIGGNGLAYSANYERFLSKNINARAGFSLFKIIENQTDKSMIVMSYPISFNYLINLSRQKHFIETGIGVMNLITSGDLVEYKGVTNYYLNPFLNFGYRYEPTKNRFLYRIGLSPFLGTTSLTNPTEQGFQPLGSKVQIWGHIGIGYRF